MMQTWVVGWRVMVFDYFYERGIASAADVYTVFLV